MERLLSFIKKEAVLCVAGVLAVISMIAVPPDQAYLSYVDCSTLATLLSLMLVVAGLTEAGVFRWLTGVLTRRFTSPRTVIFILVLTCFVSSAFITNDVALITFVPFTIELLGTRSQKRLIWTVVTETVAANLGSLVTPMGNPQNLFLYHFYQFTAADFLRTMLPLGILSLAVCAVLAVLTPGGEALTHSSPSTAGRPSARTSAALASVNVLPNRRQALLWCTAFILCVSCVAGFVPWWLCLSMTALAALFANRSLFQKVDYSLLVTFVFFFLFVGNIARMEPVSRFIREALAGRELPVSALASQVVSNVPAAAMLAPFTENARALLYGVNIGGLGTLIASMASLISYRRYAASADARRGRYMAVFTCINFSLLVLLLLLSAYMF